MPSCKASVGSSTPTLLFLDLRTHGGGIKWPRAGAILADHYSLAWRTMDAQHWGVPQRRLRISLVLDLTGGRAGEILFEPESLRGHFAPGITPGQGAAGAVENGAGTADRAFTLKIRSGCEGGGKGALVQTEKSATLSTLQDQTLFVAEPPKAYSFDSLASNSMKSSNPHSGCREVEIAKTLDTSPPDPAKNQGGIAILDVLPFDTTQITSPQNGNNPHFGDPCHPLAATAHPPAVVCLNHINPVAEPLKQRPEVGERPPRQGRPGSLPRH